MAYESVSLKKELLNEARVKAQEEGRPLANWVAQAIREKLAGGKSSVPSVTPGGKVDEVTK